MAKKKPVKNKWKVILKFDPANGDLLMIVEADTYYVANGGVVVFYDEELGMNSPIAVYKEYAAVIKDVS